MLERKPTDLKYFKALADTGKKAVEQIRRVFDDNSRIIFVSSP